MLAEEISQDNKGGPDSKFDLYTCIKEFYIYIYIYLYMVPLDINVNAYLIM